MAIDKEALAAKKAEVRNTLACPHCDEKLERVDASGNALGGWGSETIYVCISDDCSYFRGSVEVLAAQGATGGAYRFFFDPEKGSCGPISASTVWMGKR